VSLRNLRLLVLLGLVCTAAGCASRLTSETLQTSRRDLMHQAWAEQIFDPDRAVSHASHACSLRIDEQWYPVLDVQELVKGDATPRGVNTIVVLDPNLKVAQRLPYTTERPLFCLGNRLYVWGDLRVDGGTSEGNELTFTDRARQVTLAHVEANDVPAPSGKQAPIQ
jgi:hypothetical protein